MTFNTSNMIQELGKSILEVQTRFKNILINIFCRPPESALSARLSSRHILILFHPFTLARNTISRVTSMLHCNKPTGSMTTPIVPLN